MTPPMVPPGRGPLAARLAGLHLLFCESALRLRSLQAVVEDVADGVVLVKDETHEIMQLIAGSLSSEISGLERLIVRLRALAEELRQ